MQSRARRPVAALALLDHSTLLFRAQLMVLSALVLALISGVVIAGRDGRVFRHLYPHEATAVPVPHIRAESLVTASDDIDHARHERSVPLPAFQGLPLRIG
jgi:hypothetical protein